MIEELPEIDKLKELGSLSETLDTINEDIAMVEGGLSKLKDQKRRIEFILMPAMMTDIGLTEFTCKDGTKVHLSEWVSTKISQENEEEAHQWLKDNNFDSIIKNVLTANYGKGEDEDAQKAFDQLKEMGYSPALKKSVHASTLKAFITDLLNKDVNLPMELFGVEVSNYVKIKKGN